MRAYPPAPCEENHAGRPCTPDVLRLGRGARRRRGAARLTAVRTLTALTAAGAFAAAGALVAPALAGPAGAALGSDQVVLGPARGAVATVPASAAGDRVRGVLERISVEQPPGSLRPDGVTVWIRSGTEHVPVDPGPVASVPTGTAVTARLAPPTVPNVPRRILSLSVAAQAAANGVPSLTGGGVHAVTVVLALPPGGHADTTTTARLSTAVEAAARFWSQQSDDRITFEVAHAVGRLQLAHSCTDVWGLWDEAAQRSGFVPGTRRHLLVYVPPDAGCPSGLGTVSASASDGGYALVDSTMTGLLAHELGHNLGLGHSDELSCTGTSDGTYLAGRWATGCTHQAYGDWYDVMGISWDNLGTLSTAHAYQLGLLGPSAVISVTGPAPAVLHPVSGRTGLRSLRIADPGGATYVVEYRPADGDDAWISGPADWRGLRPGVLVRRIDPQDPTRTLLLDASPTPGGPAGTDWDFPLTPGQSLTTASGRVTITVESEATTATVRVSVDGVSPESVIAPGGPLVNGSQVTIADAPAAWAAGAR